MCDNLAFHAKKRCFHRSSSRVVADATAGRHDAVAWDEKWHRIEGTGCANGARCARMPDSFRNLTVRARFPEGDCGQCTPHGELERSSCGDSDI